ncbi:DUF1648 domain-containing protein [Collinsella vaginalis]|uniref:DUF1648 domain-containing protein n=1 Tax=Collinsella vaginalis TaxID=1870987 RepID=UPI000A269D11|nr:DUF1648 domain-containing protein [Collinsella vaginalis]
MFRYGTRGGVMFIALVVLALIPLVTAAVVVPGLADSVPMKIAADGEVLRYGSRFELLMLPALCTLLGLATAGSAGKQARERKGESEVTARMTYERYLRNGLVTAVVLNAANAYLFYMVLSGHGIGF